MPWHGDGTPRRDGIRYKQVRNCLAFVNVFAEKVELWVVTKGEVAPLVPRGHERADKTSDNPIGDSAVS